MKPRGKIRALIFDLGNVLVDVDAKSAALRIAGLSGKSCEEIFAFFFESRLTGDFETGKISAEELFTQVRSSLGFDIGYAEFVNIWNGIFYISATNRKVLDLVVSLSADYRLAMLTNTNILHYEYLVRTMPDLFSPFHHVITSFEAGLRKPDPQIYQLALSRLSSSPEETFYTDDRPDLVQAACGLRIRGSVFSGFDKLTADLAAGGIQTDAYTA